MSIRVVVADDHEVVRRGIAAMLAVEDIEIVGEASTGAEAVTSTQALQPDIVLMDIRMPDGNGIDSTRAIREKCPDVKVIIFSGYDNPTYVARSATAGAVDYVLKGLSRGYLLAAIRRAVGEEGPTPDGLMHRIKHIMGSRRDRLETPNFNLTHREYQVLRHIALGLSNREISESLSISVETVKEHVQNILRKVNASDRTQAAVWAVKEKLL